MYDPFSRSGLGEVWPPMKLYKYRALEPFEHVADIICKKRFHAARFYELNDPMEGLFESGPDMSQEDVRQIREAKGSIRLCSFSRTAACPVLWAHYAGGFRGICIEIESTAFDDSLRWTSVEYSPIRNILSSQFHASVASVFPETLLTRKAEDWRLEQEVRVFTNDEFIYCRDDVKKVLLGLRASDIMKTMIRQIVPPAVPVWTTRIGDRNEIEVDAEVPLR